MRIGNETRPKGWGPGAFTGKVWAIYHFGFVPDDERAQLLAALPPAEHLATFRWLFPEGDLAAADRGDYALFEYLFVLARVEETAPIALPRWLHIVGSWASSLQRNTRATRPSRWSSRPMRPSAASAASASATIRGSDVPTGRGQRTPRSNDRMRAGTASVRAPTRASGPSPRTP